MSAYEPIHRATQPDGYEDTAAPVLTSRVQDDDFERFVLRADGSMVVGDGTEEPADPIGVGANTVETGDLQDGAVTTAKLGPQSVNTQVDSYTLVLADAGKLVTLDKATAVDLTVPANATVAFPVGTRVDLAQLGAGQVTVVAAVGVTIRTAETLLLTGQYSAASLVKLATNEWLLVGDLEAA